MIPPDPLRQDVKIIFSLSRNIDATVIQKWTPDHLPSFVGGGFGNFFYSHLRLWIVALICILPDYSKGAEPPKTVAPPPPTMMEIRTAANKGEAVAQYKFGLSYQSHADYGAAFQWFRRSARQGCSEAQLALALLLLNGAPGVTRNRVEGIKWLLRAANQNVVTAQERLGDLYEASDATFVEAFKWYGLAARNRPGGNGKVDAMVLKMSAAQIEEAQKLVETFLPSPVAKVAPEFKLQGLVSRGEKRLALINGKAFSERESGEVKVDDELIKIQCLKINDGSVLISIEGETSPLTLKWDAK